jgi:hypothetical protein
MYSMRIIDFRPSHTHKSERGAIAPAVALYSSLGCVSQAQSRRRPFNVVDRRDRIVIHRMIDITNLIAYIVNNV